MSELPSSWAIEPISLFCKKLRGVSYKAQEASSIPKPEFIPIIRANNIQNEKITFDELVYVPESRVSESQKIRQYDIVIAMSSGSKKVVGKTAISLFNWNGACGAFCGILRPDIDSIYPEYFGYFFQTKHYRNSISELAVGTNINNIKNEYFDVIRIPLPPLNEQRRIVAKLEKLLAKVDTCKERLDKIPGILKRFCQSVLSAACSGRLTADWRENNPDVESAEELLKRIYQERKKRYEDECEKAKQEERRKPKQPSFGDVEEYDILSWNLTTLESVVEVVVDCPHSTPKWIENGRLCVRTNNFKPFKLDLIDVRYVSEQSYQERILRLEPQAGDVLYSREGGILGIACQIPTGVNLCLGQRMMLIRGNQNWLSGEYLTMLLNSEVVLSQVKELITGTASPHLNVSDVRSFKIPLPPLPEQQEIIRRVQTLFKTADQIEQRYQKAKSYIDQLTQSILAKAFRGELVPQDPNDEPASVLLERIRAERENRENVAKTAKKPATNKKQRSKKAQPQLEPTPQLEPIQLELPLFD